MSRQIVSVRTGGMSRAFYLTELEWGRGKQVYSLGLQSPDLKPDRVSSKSNRPWEIEPPNCSKSLRWMVAALLVERIVGHVMLSRLGVVRSP